MEKKTKKIKVLIFSMIFVILVVIAVLLYSDWRGTGIYVIPEAEPSASPEPIQVQSDAQWYTIDNVQFDIDSSGANARATTDGINSALRWAKAQGHQYIRFSEGTYMVQCTWNNRFIAPTDGILIPSGLTLDLEDATFRIEPNSYSAYCIFGVVGQSDVTISGGTLIGDVDNHVYANVPDSASHEWGFGICVSASNNVLIQGVTIRKMTGDGIILEGSYEALSDGGAVSSEVRIIGCDISECRRQGISVVGAVNSEVAGNTIYDISGTDPQFGIDVETELDYLVTNLRVHDNTIYGCSGGAISCNNGANYFVYSNKCYGNSIIAVNCNNVEIYGNTVKSSLIRVYKAATDVRVYENRLDLFSRLLIEN